jgi:3-hydroxyacyl-[acyl-carrier-protein] dehydratase
LRFHLVDRVFEVEESRRIRALKLASFADPILETHPQAGCILSPLLPVESLLQTSAWLVMVSTDFAQRGVLAGLRHVEFGRSARPGERLELVSEVRAWSAEAVVFNMEAKCGAESAVRLEGVMCFLLPTERLEDPAETRMHYQLLSVDAGAEPQPVRLLSGTPTRTAANSYLPYDAFVAMSPGIEGKAVKSVTMGDPVFATHFPRFPVVPGVLLMHSMLQVARAVLAAGEGKGLWWDPKTMHGTRFQKYVRPGDQLLISARVLGREGDEVSIAGSVEVNGAPVANIRRMILSQRKAMERPLVPG